MLDVYENFRKTPEAQNTLFSDYIRQVETSASAAKEETEKLNDEALLYHFEERRDGKIHFFQTQRNGAQEVTALTLNACPVNVSELLEHLRKSTFMSEAAAEKGNGVEYEGSGDAGDIEHTFEDEEGNGY